MCMCVCVYIYIYIYIHTHIYAQVQLDCNRPPPPLQTIFANLLSQPHVPTSVGPTYCLYKERGSERRREAPCATQQEGSRQWLFPLRESRLSTFKTCLSWSAPSYESPFSVLLRDAAIHESKGDKRCVGKTGRWSSKY